MSGDARSCGNCGRFRDEDMAGIGTCTARWQWRRAHEYCTVWKPREPGETPEAATAVETPVFVFGSNLAGRHGKGAALFAVQQRGARYGQGVGRQGNSYAIPTKDAKLRTLPLEEIRVHVAFFLLYAREHPNLTFQVTPVGTGLAGYRHEDIAPLFAGAPGNCQMPREWKGLI